MQEVEKSKDSNNLKSYFILASSPKLLPSLKNDNIQIKEITKENIISNKTIAIVSDGVDKSFLDTASRLNPDLDIIIVDYKDLKVAKIKNPLYFYSNYNNNLLKNRLKKIIFNKTIKEHFKRNINALQGSLKKSKKNNQEVDLKLRYNLNLNQDYRNQIKAQKSEEESMFKFTNEVIYNKDIESFLTSFTQELRKRISFHKLFLVSSNNDCNYEIFYINEAGLSTTKYYAKDDALLKNRGVMANLLKRPIMNISNLKVSCNLHLILEKQDNENFSESFKGWWKNNLPSITLSLQFYIEQNKILKFTMMWQKTFYLYKYPLALLNGNYNAIEMNSSFKSIITKSFGHIPENFQDFIKKDRILLEGSWYELKQYNITLFKANDSYLLQLLSIDERRNVEADWMHQEKLSSLGHLAGNLSHEITNPLSGLRLCCEELSKMPSFEQKEDLVEVQSGIDRCLSIISNFQNFSNPDYNKVDSFLISDLVKQTLPLIKTKTRDHRIETFGDDKIKIRANFALMQQVLFNLVHNSVQAIGDKSGLIQIRWLKEGSLTKVLLSDNGHGIEPELHDKIFEAFYTTKNQEEGTGLGLSISKRIVEFYGGKMNIESSPKKGCTFIISFSE